MHPPSSDTVAVQPKATEATSITNAVSSHDATITVGAQMKSSEAAFNNATANIVTKPSLATTATVAATGTATGTLTNSSVGTTPSQSSCTTIIASHTGIQSATTGTATTIKSTSLVTSGQRKQKKQFWRDENAPKPPSAAYLMFSNDHREVVRLQNPGVHYNDLSKKMGIMWSELPIDKKQVPTVGNCKQKNCIDITLQTETL